MKIRNKTNSDKELTDNVSGKRILVKAGDTIELHKASFGKNSFEIIKDTNIEQIKTKVEKISTEEKINIEKEVI